MNKLSEYNKILLLGAAALILGTTFVFLFYEREIGLNYSIFIILIATLGLLLARLFSRHLMREHYAVVVTGVLLSLMVFLRSSELLTFFNILGSSFLFLIAVLMFAGKSVHTFVTVDYVKAFFVPLRFVGSFFETFPAIVSLQNVTSENSRRKEVVRGSLMSLCALLVFALLFSSADAGFEKLFSNIFTITLDQDLIRRILLGAIVTAFFIGGFGFMFKKLHADHAPVAQAKARNLGVIETMILLGSINVLFFVFIILQIAYLFGGAEHLLAEGLTYAEYAREGFFQLVVVAILSFLIISFAERLIIQHDGVHLRSFKVLSGVLVIQVIVVLVSAFVRLSLYEDAYGFTDTRLYSHAFMIWLGIVLTLLSVHIWKSGKPADFSFRTFCSVVLLLLAVNLLNPDVFIAKKNLDRYQLTGQLDASYLGTLSDDALPHTIYLLDDSNEEVRKSFARELYRRHGYCSLDAGEGEQIRQHPWQSQRLSLKNAEELLVQKRRMFVENNKNSSWLNDCSVNERP